MTIALAPLVVSLLGLLLWLLSSNGRAQDAGRIAFAAGLLVALLESGHWLVHL